MIPSPTVYRQGQGVVPSDGLNTFVQNVATIAQLRSFSGTGGMATSREATRPPTGDRGTTIGTRRRQRRTMGLR